MLRICLTVVTTLALLLPVAAQADKGDIVLGYRGGAAVPTGAFGNWWKAGLDLGISGAYAVSPKILVGVDASYAKNKASTDYEDMFDDFGITDASFTTIQAGAHGAFMLMSGDGQVQPYVLLGAGIYNVKDKWEYSGGEDDVSTTAIGGKIGGGANFRVNPKIGIDLQVAFNATSTKEEDIGHDTTPYVSVRGGLTYTISKSGY